MMLNMMKKKDEEQGAREGFIGGFVGRELSELVDAEGSSWSPSGKPGPKGFRTEILKEALRDRYASGPPRTSYPPRIITYGKWMDNLSKEDRIAVIKIGDALTASNKSARSRPDDHK